MKKRTLFTLLTFLFSFPLLFFFSSCSNSLEPDKVTSELYKPTLKEANNQSIEVVNETIQQSSTLFAAYEEFTSPLYKNNGGRTYHYFDGWHIWRGELDQSPFNIEDSYNAEYLGKLQFRDEKNSIQELPAGASKMLWYYKAHGAFGFVDNEPYGDEIWYEVEGSATPLTGYPSYINLGGEYERRWAGIYDGVEKELHYKVNLVTEMLEFYYSGEKNDYWLNGKIMVSLPPYELVIKFNDSRTGKVKVYENGELKDSYDHEFPNFYEIYNLPSLENLEMGINFNFPAPIPL